jgi:signal transduction histidine kinase
MNKPTILIIDDEQINIDFIVQTFKTQYNIKVAYSGEEALEAIEKFDINLILLDIVLPGIDGYKVAKKIRAKGMDTPIIFLTSKTDDESIIKGFNVGGNDYVTKPFKIEELKARIFNFINTYLLQKKLKELTISQEQTIKEEIEKNRQKDALLLQQARFAAMGEMIGMIAHQWRQPLNSLSAASISIQLQQEMELLDDKFLSQKIDFFQKQIQRMSHTIEDFMGFFKPNHKIEEFAFMDSVNSIKSMMEAQLNKHEIKLEIVVEDNLKLFAIKNEMDHILLNLVANAKDAFEESNIKDKKISITLNDKGEYFEILVKDNAGGVPKDILPKIFDSYFTTKEKGKGTGIGLSMTKNMVEQHCHGNISVKNIDNGACFIITIPKKRKD